MLLRGDVIEVLNKVIYQYNLNYTICGHTVYTLYLLSKRSLVECFRINRSGVRRSIESSVRYERVKVRCARDDRRVHSWLCVVRTAESRRGSDVDKRNHA